MEKHHGYRRKWQLSGKNSIRITRRSSKTWHVLGPICQARIEDLWKALWWHKGHIFKDRDVGLKSAWFHQEKVFNTLTFAFFHSSVLLDASDWERGINRSIIGSISMEKSMTDMTVSITALTEWPQQIVWRFNCLRLPASLQRNVLSLQCDSAWNFRQSGIFFCLSETTTVFSRFCRSRRGRGDGE